MLECEESDCKLPAPPHTRQQHRRKCNIAKKLVADTEFPKVADNGWKCGAVQRCKTLELGMATAHDWQSQAPSFFSGCWESGGGFINNLKACDLERENKKAMSVNLWKRRDWVWLWCLLLNKPKHQACKGLSNYPQLGRARTCLKIRRLCI